ncbi:nucleotidyltransferase domain-containing protein [Patescibacteria group bacterium]|nr:nucleotidyltransferase domain-containing protein [Patescibacteria group bacterium]MBU1160866.1 nucleotidyltransferase domain-containing protein [Patescibacteria group bacterium]MBU1350060.1 nucleotidyltransferase domain-containing protein [Patescibacteria group bacterium]MBU1420943.1 nucleotidyltransferase domain-containing protein [Patescibacteria group bacterium]MBU1683891.1 nucleotidyltransferase domain-containing protein [Patescibacteria group bacterium]
MSEILTQQQLNKLSKKYHINTIYLFGSQAKGNITKLSDYDFAILLDDKVDAKKYGQYQINIISELLRMIKTNHIDLVILNNTKLPLLLKYNIIKDGKVLLDKNKSKRVDLEVHTFTRWFDWEYFEKMWGEIYLQKAVKSP